jgi:hypothetical protein
VKAVCAALVFAVVSCSSRRSAAVSADSTAAAVPVAVSSSTVSAAPKGSCPNTGLWAKCSIEKRLKRAGFILTPNAGKTPVRAGLGAPSFAYTLGTGSKLELFIYPDEKALGRDVAKLDTTTVAPRGASNAWGGAPLFIRSANLIAVLVSSDAREQDGVSLALVAGPPQPR